MSALIVNLTLFKILNLNYSPCWCNYCEVLSVTNRIKDMSYEVTLIGASSLLNRDGIVTI